MSTNKNYYKEYIDSLKTAADTNYTQAVNNAELERQRAVLEAGNQYNSSRATSGATAQALSSSGLTGSGYSRYLDSQAYAQKQGSINSAFQNKQSAINAAEGVKNDKYMTAEGLYADYLAKKEAERQTNYTNISNNLESYTLSDIDRLGAEYDFDEDTITALKKAKNDRVASSLLASGTGYYKSDLDQLVAAGVLDVNSDAYKNLSNNLKNLTENDIYGMFDDVEKSKAEATLKGVLSAYDSTIESDKKIIDALNAEFERAYAPKITLKKDYGLSKKEGKAGNNITVEDEDGNKYYAEYSSWTLSKDAAEKANVKNLTVGTVFKYNGNLYIKGADKCYLLVAPKAHQNSFNDLKNKFK